MTAASQARRSGDHIDSDNMSASSHTLYRLAQSLSPQQWAWLDALDPNFHVSALQALHAPRIASSEKRGAMRRRVLLGAKIIFNGRNSVVDCQISDISATGCKLKVVGSSHIPHRFTLSFNASHVSRECEIAWHNENVMGVRFLDDAPPA